MLWQSLRLTGQFCRAGWLVAWHFPGLPRQGRQQAVQRWARQVLAILRVQVQIQVPEHGQVAVNGQARPLPSPDFAGLLVSNHLSWLDVLVLQSLMPVAFVAKAEVRRWPVVGYLAQACATVFVDRGSVRSTGSMVHSTAQAIAEGYAVVAFPEGTSSDGAAVGSFHANIFESAIRSGAPVQPLRLHYADPHTGAAARSAHFTGDMTLLTSLAAILRSPGIQARVQFGECIAPQGQTRKSLALLAHRQVSNLLPQ